MGNEKFVIDSSALVGGFEPMPKEGIEYYVTHSVINELKSKLADEKLDLMIELNLKILEPSKEFRDKLQEKAFQLGELPRLSKVDLDILALALELGATIITDDYSIQNVAKEIGIKYLAFAQKGITKKMIWKKRCSGCGKYFSNYSNSCPICGSKIKAVGKF